MSKFLVSGSDGVMQLLRDLGHSAPSIAKLTGESEHVVYQYTQSRKAQGLEPITEEERREIEEQLAPEMQKLRDRGLACDTIGDMLKVQRSMANAGVCSLRQWGYLMTFDTSKRRSQHE